MGRLHFPLLWIGAALLASPVAAWAVCFSHPSVADEIKESALIVTARVVGSRELAASGPDGIDGTLYKVRVEQSFKGQPARTVEIHSENSSGRFPMDRDKQYLLFISGDPDGLVVNACGNSGELKHRASLVRALQDGTALRDHRHAPPDNSPD